MANLLETAIMAARAGGKLAIERAAGTLTISQKGLRDFVTDADVAAQDAILEVVRARHPDHGILSEEGLDDYTLLEEIGPLWIIDPIDGTGNYSHRFPFFCASVAVTEGGEPVAGAVFDPVRGEMFAAARGEGATLNGEPLHVTDRPTLDGAFIGFDWARRDDLRQDIHAKMGALLPHIQSVRVTGAAALGIVYVAAGRTDAYIHPTLYPWDMAAGMLIVREAGGTVTDLYGQPMPTPDRKSLLVSNGLIHDAILGVIHES